MTTASFVTTMQSTSPETGEETNDVGVVCYECNYSYTLSNNQCVLPTEFENDVKIAAIVILIFVLIAAAGGVLFCRRKRIQLPCNINRPVTNQLDQPMEESVPPNPDRPLSDPVYIVCVKNASCCVKF